jgi:hypothetical protein
MQLVQPHHDGVDEYGRGVAHHGLDVRVAEGLGGDVEEVPHRLPLLELRHAPRPHGTEPLVSANRGVELKVEFASKICNHDAKYHISGSRVGSRRVQAHGVNRIQRVQAAPLGSSSWIRRCLPWARTRTRPGSRSPPAWTAAPACAPPPARTAPAAPAPRPRDRVVTPRGCQDDYMDRTGAHKLTVF